MIIFDLDGTLADCEHRRNLVDANTGRLRCGEKWKPDWDAFYEACDQDNPIEPVIEILVNFWILNGSEIEIWSGRSAKVEQKTLSWLRKYIFICGRELCPVKMRDIDDFTPDNQLKEKWLNQALSNGKEIEYVFDDRPEVIRMWRRRGIFVFNCSQHDKEF